jgi:hypothetical protein
LYKQQQVQITEWLTNWSDDLPAPTSAGVTKEIDKDTLKGTGVIQTKLDMWLHQNDNDSRDDGLSDECSIDPAEDDTVIPKEQIHYNNVCDRKIVADGTHQCGTTNTCLLVS